MIGSTDEFATDGIECPPNDFAGLKIGKYALAVAERKGPVAILTSPQSENEGETCITFYYNIPVNIIFKQNQVVILLKSHYCNIHYDYICIALN